MYNRLWINLLITEIAQIFKIVSERFLPGYLLFLRAKGNEKAEKTIESEGLGCKCLLI